MQLTEAQLLRILPYARSFAGVFVPALNRAMARFKIDSPARAAAFLAQIGHESAQLLRLSENLNYSAARLAVVWPSRFRAPCGPEDQCRTRHNEKQAQDGALHETPPDADAPERQRAL